MRRTKDGRPYIWRDCPKCSASGTQPSQKRPGRTVQCPACRGAGRTETPYSRVTSYIDVLDDKTKLAARDKRLVLLGAAQRPALLAGAADRDPDNAGDKAWLDRQAAIAFATAGGNAKADRGTWMHGLSERVDQKLELPPATSFHDVLDMDAYRATTQPVYTAVLHLEQLIVLDELKVAGTPDRVITYSGPGPDGQPFTANVIADLKTGSITWTALKIAMQLAIYARGHLYDPATGHRQPLPDVSHDWGLVVHLPAGSAICTLHWANLQLGWQAVQLARQVRSIRRQGLGALTAVVTK
ncbi:hypothetical protein [Kribbella deserti]|uniref:PD-(D/E)XK endonuclease-like domain-containing protein n=1 Tax=Kribbella deserti TaxID=1926257 RepID=A0ABV6QDW3_9ACTN